MAQLSSEFVLPLKVVTARSENLKYHFKGILSKVEHRIVQRLANNEKIEFLTRWDDWLYAALDCQYPGWDKNLKVGDQIPGELLHSLACPTGELVSLGTWMLTKNVYRFADEISNELVKSKFEGTLPNYLINIPDLCIYVQTDNFDLELQGSKIYGVIFTITELCLQKVLVSTVFLDTGLSQTIVMVINDKKTIDECILDFIKEFQDNNLLLDESTVLAFQELQKKLINIILWFSLTKPDYMPLVPENHKEVTGIRKIKNTIRLFEAQKYKPYIAGNEMAGKIRAINQKIKEYKESASASSQPFREPHLRKAHYHLYWYGKRGKFERHDFLWIPTTLVSGNVDI